MKEQLTQNILMHTHYIYLTGQLGLYLSLIVSPNAMARSSHPPSFAHY